jgi:hypothetical protein
MDIILQYQNQIASSIVVVGALTGYWYFQYKAWPPITAVLLGIVIGFLVQVFL